MTHLSLLSASENAEPVTPLPASSPELVEPAGNRGPKVLAGKAAPPSFLDAVPLLGLDAKMKRGCSVFETEPSSLAAEQFRLMQRRLANVRPMGGSVLLTSPGPGDGKSLNAHNLAWALAETGQNTLLLELDFRRPSQAKYFGCAPVTSLDTALTERLPPQAALSRIPETSLYFAGLRQACAHPVDLLRSEQLREFLSWAKRHFAWVIMDVPPVLPVADVEELLPSADLVLMVVRERGTPRAALARAGDRLGKRLSYILYNEVTFSPAYGYGYRYDR